MLDDEEREVIGPGERPDRDAPGSPRFAGGILQQQQSRGEAPQGEEEGAFEIEGRRGFPKIGQGAPPSQLDQGRRRRSSAASGNAIGRRSRCER